MVEDRWTAWLMIGVAIFVVLWAVFGAWFGRAPLVPHTEDPCPAEICSSP